MTREHVRELSPMCMSGGEGLRDWEREPEFGGSEIRVWTDGGRSNCVQFICT